MTEPYDWTQTLLSQFANSGTILQLIDNMSWYFDPTKDFDAFFDLVWDIDTAEGWGLDNWGRILGVGRVLQLGNATYFGFTGPTDMSGDSFGGGPVTPPTSPFYRGQDVTDNYALTDDAYRVLLLAKALANITDGSIGSINQILINLFLAPAVPGRTGNAYVVDGLDMTMQYKFAITPPLTAVEVAIVSQSGVLPRSTGVSATTVQV